MAGSRNYDFLVCELSSSSALLGWWVGMSSSEMVRTHHTGSVFGHVREPGEVTADLAHVSRSNSS